MLLRIRKKYLQATAYLIYIYLNTTFTGTQFCFNPFEVLKVLELHTAATPDLLLLSGSSKHHQAEPQRVNNFQPLMRGEPVFL